MTKKKKQIEYRGGRIKTLVEHVAKIVAKDPSLAENPERLHATLKAGNDKYGRREECFNCDRSMQITEYTAGIVEGLLILAMAREVREKQRNGATFTEANLTHIPTLGTTDAIRHAITRASYLGIVAQPPKIRNSGHWVITSWGWKLLRGEPIPRSVKYWEGQLIGRSEETTTLSAMFQTHTDLIKRALEQRKKIRSDYRTEISAYSPAEWLEYREAITEGALF